MTVDLILNRVVSFRDCHCRRAAVSSSCCAAVSSSRRGHAAVLSSRRLLAVSPSRCLVAPAGCCVLASRRAAVSFSHRAAVLLSYRRLLTATAPPSRRLIASTTIGRATPRDWHWRHPWLRIGGPLRDRRYRPTPPSRRGWQRS